MGIVEFMALANVLAELISQGRTTYTKIRGFLQQEGATPEQLAYLDARLTHAIEERERQQAQRPLS